jgi:hypothetical protein
MITIKENVWEDLWDDGRILFCNIHKVSYLALYDDNLQWDILEVQNKLMSSIFIFCYKQNNFDYPYI